MDFRTLEASEIDCRVATVNEKGVTLLLYKDARVDQNILDETVGQMNWQRHHSRENANCIVSIWDENKKQWIEKEDTGKESFSEAEKGLASDSFKRACFNWGIGRELYTAPFIWIPASKAKIVNENGKQKCKEYFFVKEIKYDGKKNITYLSIKNSKGEVVFEDGMVFDTKSTESEETKQETKQETIETIGNKTINATKVKVLEDVLKSKNIPLDNILKPYKVKKLADLTEKQFSHINMHWKEVAEWKPKEG